MGDQIGGPFELAKIFSKSLILSPMNDLWRVNTGFLILYLTLSVMLLLTVEWFNRKSSHGLNLEFLQNKYLRWLIYYILIVIIFFMNTTKQEFIYFQF